MKGIIAHHDRFMEIQPNSTISTSQGSLKILELMSYRFSKRLVCLAELNQQRIVVKIVFEKERVDRFLKGYHLFQQNHIPTPEVLFTERCQDFYIIVFPYLADYVRFDLLLQQASTIGQIQLLKNLIHSICQMHQKNIIQADLRFENFLVKQDHIVALDPDMVKKIKSKKQLLENFCFFLNTINEQIDEQVNYLIDFYITEMDMINPIKTKSNILKLKEKIRDKIKSNALKKSMKTQENILRQKDLFSKSYWYKHFLEIAKEFTLSPEQFINTYQKEIITQHSHIKKYLVEFHNKKFTVIQFTPSNFWQRLKSFFTSSEAKEHWKIYHFLKMHHIENEQPIGYQEKRFGPFLLTSYYLSIQG